MKRNQILTGKQCYRSKHHLNYLGSYLICGRHLFRTRNIKSYINSCQSLLMTPTFITAGSELSVYSCQTILTPPTITCTPVNLFRFRPILRIHPSIFSDSAQYHIYTCQSFQIPPTTCITYTPVNLFRFRPLWPTFSMTS